jgi:hypothetical protein
VFVGIIRIDVWLFYTPFQAPQDDPKTIRGWPKGYPRGLDVWSILSRDVLKSVSDSDSKLIFEGKM